MGNPENNRELIVGNHAGVEGHVVCFVNEHLEIARLEPIDHFLASVRPSAKVVWEECGVMVNRFDMIIKTEFLCSPIPVLLSLPTSTTDCRNGRTAWQPKLRRFVCRDEYRGKRRSSDSGGRTCW